MILILKPTLSCNLRCKYCYLSECSKVSTTFDVDFAKSVLLQAKLLLAKNQKIKILWHGGEPLLWGIDNFRTILPFIEDLFGDVDFKISIQTNLTLINKEFVDLFVRYNVHVGTSLDGPKDIHDSLRTTIDGKGTFDLVLDKIDFCRSHGLKVGCITVGTHKHIGKIEQLYRFMRDHQIGFKFNPIFNAGEARKSIDELGLTHFEYSEMAIELFDLWFNDKQSKISNAIFADIASSMISRRNCSHCLFLPNCQKHVIAISPKGDVVPCGRFCDDELINLSYGNLHTDSLSTIVSRMQQSDIYKRHEYIAKSNCSQCEYYYLCYGGCMFDGYIKSNDFKSKSFLCCAYKKIFKHIESELQNAGMINK